MEDDNNVDNTPRVPRSMAPRAPAYSLFPNVPFDTHASDCVRDVRTTTCTCGLWERRLANGDFVKYVAKVSLAKTMPDVDLEAFLKETAKRARALDMSKWGD